MKQWKRMPLICLVNHAYLKNPLELVNQKLPDSLKANLQTYFSTFIFPFFSCFFFSKFWTNLLVCQNDFPLKFLKGNDKQSWIGVGFIKLVLWSRLRVWKQMWIVKTQKDVMVFWNNDLWIMLHHKFICLLCVHHFSFFSLNIDSFFFLLDVTKSSSSFFCLFQNFFDSDGFFYWWTVYQTKVQTINVRWPLFKVIWKKNICSFKS